jgi:hypothetical protein
MLGFAGYCSMLIGLRRERRKGQAFTDVVLPRELIGSSTEVASFCASCGRRSAHRTFLESTTTSMRKE